MIEGCDPVEVRDTRELPPDVSHETLAGQCRELRAALSGLGWELARSFRLPAMLTWLDAKLRRWGIG